jgi:hypothetical protein
VGDGVNVGLDASFDKTLKLKGRVNSMEAHVWVTQYRQQVCIHRPREGATQGDKWHRFKQKFGSPATPANILSQLHPSVCHGIRRRAVTRWMNGVRPTLRRYPRHLSGGADGNHGETGRNVPVEIGTDHITNTRPEATLSSKEAHSIALTRLI